MTPELSRILLTLILAGSAILIALLLRRGRASGAGPDGGLPEIGWRSGSSDVGTCDGGGDGGGGDGGD